MLYHKLATGCRVLIQLGEKQVGGNIKKESENRVNG